MKTKKHILVALIALNAICAQAVQYPARSFHPGSVERIWESTPAIQPTNGNGFDLNGRIVETHCGQADVQGLQKRYVQAVVQAIGQTIDETSALTVGFSEDSVFVEDFFEDRGEDGLFAIASASPIRRASSGFPNNPYDGQIYTDGNGVTWVYYGGGWFSQPIGPTQGDISDDRMPIGSPVLPFLLFALLACGVIYYRRRPRSLLFILTFLSCLSATAQTVPAVTPAINNARLKVVGQNMHNYFLTLTNSFSESKTQAQLDAKTAKIAQVFAAMDADIYAMCELEVCDTVVGYITRALNEQVGENRYAYIHDGFTTTQDGQTKVGFIYRPSKVTPLTTTSYYSTGSNTTVYGRRMRWIGFKENATHEKFVLSMNHFKAKDSSADQGESQRLTNAQNLYRAFSSMQRTDPDILVLGDLNCQTDEAPIQYLINTAGLEEQLERFNSSAYSYYYKGSYQLIDHAMANATCAEQIAGAGLCHVNTQYPYNSLRYSDHDLYMVGLNLGVYNRGQGVEDVEDAAEPAAEKMLFEGRIYILRGDHIYDSMGRLVK